MELLPSSSLGEMQGQVTKHSCHSPINLMSTYIFSVHFLGSGYVGPKWSHTWVDNFRENIAISLEVT